MAKPGPPRKPTELKRKLGNPGQKPLPAKADVVALPMIAEMPDPPRSLGSAGREAWANIWNGPARLWLSLSDVMALQLWCEMVDDYTLLRTRLYKAMTDPDHQSATPTWRLRKQVMELGKELLVRAGEFGLTPAARASLGVAEVRIEEGRARLADVNPDDHAASFARVIDV